MQKTRLTRIQAEQQVGYMLVEQVEQIPCKPTGRQPGQPRKVEFAATVESSTEDGACVKLTAYYLQPWQALVAWKEDHIDLDWNVSGYEVHYD